MIPLFWFYFACCGILTRAITPSLHFKNKTLTGWLRNKTQKNIHHLHFGLIIGGIAMLVMLLSGVTKVNLFFIAIGGSFVADEMFIIKDYNKYFEKNNMLYSILGHILIGALLTATLWFM